MTSSPSCPKCGGPRDAKALYCPFCGVVFSRYPPEAQAGPEAPPSLPAPGPAAAGEFNPYQAPEAPVAAKRFAFQNEDHTVLAERFTRLAARFLDGLIYIGPVILMILLAVPGPEIDETVAVIFLMVIIGWLVGVFIINLALLSTDGQTMGKKMLKIRIVRVSGGKAGLGRIFVLRMLAPNLVGMLPVVGTIFGILNILFIFGPERRCLHDYFADTKVVMA